MRPDPLKLLEKIDTILDCINMRFVIFLEDIDRNAQENIFRNEIYSLFDRLKALKNISFVITINSEEQKSGILVRISEHIETIPELHEEEVKKIIRSFREHNIIYSSEKDNEKLGMSQLNEMGKLLEGAINIKDKQAIFQITKLLNNPRNIKYAIRRTKTAWNSLKGEINFDNLLIANILRTGAPEAYGYILDNIAELRKYINQEADFGEMSDNRRDELREKCNNIAKNAQWHIQSVIVLINFLFPGFEDIFNLKAKGDQSHGFKDISFQGIAKSRPVDYWVRLNAEEIAPKEIKDSVIIKMMDDWKGNLNNKEFINNIIRKSKYAKQLDYICSYRLAPENILNLVSAIFRQILDEEGNRANLDHDNREHLHFWHIRKLFSESEHTQIYNEWFLKEIVKVLQLSLRFANDIYHYFGGIQLNVRYNFCDARTRNDIIQKAREYYEGNIELFKVITQDLDQIL
jgi:hypothetical protein